MVVEIIMFFLHYSQCNYIFTVITAEALSLSLVCCHRAVRGLMELVLACCWQCSVEARPFL